MSVGITFTGRLGNNWEQQKAQIDALNARKRKEYEANVAQWQDRKAEFVKTQEKRNQRILEKKQAFFDKDPEAIADYCEMVLSNSDYPTEFPQEWDLEYRVPRQQEFPELARTCRY